MENNEYKLLSELVSIDTSTNNTREFCCKLINILENFDFNIYKYGTGDSIGFIAKNQTALKWDKQNKKYFIFSGHADTVSYEKKEWKTHPLELKLINNKLYGLGVCDMKGAIYSFFKTFIDNYSEMKDYPIGINITHEEEIGSVKNFAHISERPDTYAF